MCHISFIYGKELPGALCNKKWMEQNRKLSLIFSQSIHRRGIGFALKNKLDIYSFSPLILSEMDMGMWTRSVWSVPGLTYI